MRRLDRDLDDEIRAHVSMAAADRVDCGESPAEAHLRARRELGNELLIKEVTRDMWGWTRWERMAQNLKLALRQMRRNPGFALVAVLTLGIGLGATTAMFSIVNGVLLEPLKYRDPQRLYVVRTVPPASLHIGRDFPVNARHFHEWRQHCRSCAAVSLVQFNELTLVGAGAPVRLPGLSISYDFFRTLGVAPAMGRDFAPEEEKPGRFEEVILADALWRTRFAADRGIVGRQIQLNGEPHTVIGVMPPDLQLPAGDQWGAFFGPSAAPLIFRPLGLEVSSMRPAGNLNYVALVRLQPGVTAPQATAELNALLADFVRQFRLVTKAAMFPLQQQVTRGARSALWLLMGAVGAVLLIVCVNIGNLMLVRTAGRYREAGVRMALGAGRGAMFAMVLGEALVLVAAGGALGFALARVGLRIFVAAAPVTLPRMAEVRMDWRVAAFAAVAMAFSTVACGLIPAWRLARTQPIDSLKGGAGQATEGGRKLRLREWLVGAEVALSAILLVVGGLLMLSFLRVLRVEKGFGIEHIITQDVSFLSPKYSHGGRRRYMQQLMPELARIPGVRAAGAINKLPLRGEDWVSDLIDPDRPPPAGELPGGPAGLANFRFIAPGYFQAMRIPLKQGRFLDDRDENQPHAVVSERAAQFLWPGQNPLGRHVEGPGQPAPKLEVVGVVGEVRTGGLDQAPVMMVYEHYWRMQPIGISFVLRAQGDARAAAVDLRNLLAAADPEMALEPAQTMQQIVDESVASRKFEMGLAVTFAVAALLLASLGIYGVISFTVARRTPELGIRIALGARRGQLMRLVLRQGLRPVAAGLAVGLAAALALSKLLASELYGVKPRDPLTMAAVAALLLAVAVAACWAPARRATRIDPLGALRVE